MMVSSILKRCFGYARQHAFVGLLMLFAIGVVFTCYVLPFSYVHWIDDVMINEMGRFPIGPHSFDWNMNWYQNPIMNAQSSMPYYLGGAFLEVGYLLWGEVGPRIVVFSAFLLSTVFLFFYLKRKSGGRNFAALLALLYFSYPLLPVFVRGARVEPIVFLFVIISVWIFAFKPRTTIGKCGLFALSGGLFVLSVFTWVSAALLGPLVLWEMIDRLREDRDNLRQGIVFLSAAAIGSIISAGILLIPFYSIFWQNIDVLIANFEIGATGHATNGWMVKEFLELFCGFPGFFMLALPMLFCYKRLWMLAFLTWAGLCVCMATNFYNSRMVYFVPTAIVGVAVVWRECQNPLGKKLLLVIVACMTAISFGRTCLFRNLTDCYARSMRDYAAVKRIFERELGKDCRVYNAAYELYYVGRDLGWKQYRSNARTLIPADELYPLVDHYVCNARLVKPELEKSLSAHGFRLRGEYFDRNPKPSSAVGRILYKTGRLVPFLGPYRIYDR